MIRGVKGHQTSCKTLIGVHWTSAPFKYRDYSLMLLTIYIACTARLRAYNAIQVGAMRACSGKDSACTPATFIWS